MKSNYSRRDFLNRTGLALASAGSATVLSSAATAAETEEKSAGMADGPEYNARAFAHSLKGIGFNLLVTDVEASVEFAEKVLLAHPGRVGKFSAVLTHREFSWMYHSDWAYRNNPLSERVKGVEWRGQGVALRLYDQDPDETEQRARDSGYEVLAGSANKPHGLRECFILEPEGYCWVISRDLEEGEK